MSHLPIAKAAELAGISRRHLQRLMAGGVPWAKRTQAGRWQINGEGFKRWAAGFKRWGGSDRREPYEGRPLGALKQSAAGSKRRRRVSARQAVEDLDQAAREVRQALARMKSAADYLGALLGAERAARNSQFSQWVRDELSPLKIEDAKWLAYMAERGGGAGPVELVKRLVSAPKRRGKQSAGASSLAWIKWTGKIDSAFQKMSLSTLDEADRRSYLHHLEPIRQRIADLEKPLKQGRSANR